MSLKAGLFVSLALAASAAGAATFTLSWTNPTTNTDGSTIPATGVGALAQTRVEFGACPGGTWAGAEGEKVVLAPLTTTTITGGWLGGERVCFRAFSKNNLGVESAASAVVSKLLDAPTPRPPVLSTTITVAWELNITGSGQVLLGRQVGEVPLGTPCLAETWVTNKGEFNVLDPTTVLFHRTPRSSVVVGICA